MSSSSEKPRIANNFSRAASVYADHAILQKQVEQQLLSMLPAQSADTVVDLGCGPCLVFPRLQEHYPTAKLIGLDLSYGMLREASKLSKRQRCLCVADADQLPLASNSVDVLFSSLALQWCQGLQHVLQQAHRVVRPGGTLAFSTLACGTLDEVHQAWASIDDYEHTNEFATVAEQYRLLLNSPWQLQAFRARTEQLHFPSAKALLKNLRQTGVNTVLSNARAGLLTRNQYRAVEASFEQFREASGIPLRYRTLYVVLHKPK